MRITTPAAPLAAQSASTCSAYKRARSIWQCVVKFFGSASGTRGGGVGGVGVACRRAKEAAKKFCVVANFSAYFAHKTEAAFHFPLFFFVCYFFSCCFFFLLFCLLPACLASFRFSFQLQVPRFFSFKCFNRNLSNWKIKGLQRRRQKFLLVLLKGGRGVQLGRGLEDLSYFLNV